MNEHYDSLIAKRNDVEHALSQENTHPQQTWLNQELQRLNAEIDDYPLAEDDLFACNRCEGVFDNDDSHRVGKDELYCSECHIKHVQHADIKG